MVKKYHPDIISSTNLDQEKAHKAFLKINDAYKILKDSEKRDKYDKARDFAEKNYKNQKNQGASQNYDDFVKDNFEFRKKYDQQSAQANSGQYDYWARKDYTEGKSEFNNKRRYTEQEKYKARKQDYEERESRREGRHYRAINGGWLV